MSLKDLLKKAKNVKTMKESGFVPEDMEGSFNDIPFHINIRTPDKDDLITILKNLTEELEEVDGEVPLHLTKKLIMEAFQIAFAQDSRAKGVFHPSSYSIEDKHCHRKMYYEYANIKPDASHLPITHDNRMQRLFDLGTMVHLYVQYNLMREGVLIDFEVPISEPEFGVEGKADGIIDFVGFDHFNVFHEKDKRILEVKTMFSFGFNKLRGASDSHVKQGSIYGHFLGLDEIVFLYYSKDTSEHKIFVEKVDHSYAQKFKDDATLVINKYKGEVRRTRTRDVEKHDVFHRVCRTISDKKAMDCPYRDQCFNMKN